MFNFLAQRFSSIFSGFGQATAFTEQNISKVITQIQEALIQSDVPYEVVDIFLTQLKTDLIGQKITKGIRPDEQLLKIVYQRMVNFLGQESAGFVFQIPSVIMVMGLQGSGKTTTIAKLAYHAKMQAVKKHKKRSILVASVDFYRPAAIDQLEILAAQVGVDFYRATSSHSIQAADEIFKQFKKGGYDLLFFDTAGRLHVDQQMLLELKEIEKRLTPKYKLLVLDAMTGQQSLAVAQSFDKEIGFYASVMTKMDSDAAGGAIFAFRYVLKRSIWFIGTGEKIEDLQEFYPDRIAQRMLSMGDLQTLMEKVDTKVKVAEQEKMGNAMLSGTVTLEDFAQQIDMISQLGTLSSIMQYIPSSMMQIDTAKMKEGDGEMRKFRAIINSMTLKERRNASLIDVSRKMRIAKGAGVQEKDVVLLLERFEQVKQYAKLLRKSGPFKGLFR
ncbi:MAG TPA: signal recognition particle receptor subunit alpha [Patescibacteria group bacterium]|jgi:signal recognition particle subunit SRP54|nr:signal recognition particle receptor subunit alpha [Patescibacteria group bacterium]